jgi:hypothetical protein
MSNTGTNYRDASRNELLGNIQRFLSGDRGGSSGVRVESPKRDLLRKWVERHRPDSKDWKDPELAEETKILLSSPNPGSDVRGVESGKNRFDWNKAEENSQCPAPSSAEQNKKDLG